LGFSLFPLFLSRVSERSLSSLPRHRNLQSTIRLFFSPGSSSSPSLKCFSSFFLVVSPFLLGHFYWTATCHLLWIKVSSFSGLFSGTCHEKVFAGNERLLAVGSFRRIAEKCRLSLPRWFSSVRRSLLVLIIAAAR